MIGKIYVPGTDSTADRYVVAQFCYRDGPRATKLVADMVAKVCGTFMVEPESLADSVGKRHSTSYCEQVVLVEYPCPYVPGEGKDPCEGFAHGRYTFYGKHWAILRFNGTANEVCARLREWFKPIGGRNSQAAAGGIPLPDLGSLEERIGLSDFIKEVPSDGDQSGPVR